MPIDRGMMAKVKRGRDNLTTCEARECIPMPVAIFKIHPSDVLGMPALMITALVQIPKRAPAEHADVPIPVLRSFGDRMGMAVRCSALTRDEKDLALSP